MADATAKEPSMEDILASIRKIISQDDSKIAAPRQVIAPIVPPLVSVAAPPPGEGAAFAHAAAASPAFAQTLAAQTLAAQTPAAAPVVAQPVLQSAPVSAPRPPVATTLAELAIQVKNQMPHPAETRETEPAPYISATIAPASPIAPPVAPAPVAAYRPFVAANEPQEPIPAIAPASPAAAIPAPPNASEEAAFRDALASPSTNRLVGDSISRLKAAVADDNAARVETILRPMLREWLDANLPNLVEKMVRAEIERIVRG